MCTVIYYPSKEKVFIVSLRDEKTDRPVAIKPQYYYHNNLKYIAPKDGLAGGTWVGINELGTSAVLLNGGFKNHKINSAYTKSRGTIIISLLTSSKPINYWDNYNLFNVAPFTIILLYNHNLFKLVWDGNNKHTFNLDNSKPQIWSSVTLYDEEARFNREKRFNEWLQKKEIFSIKNMLKFFKEFPNEQNGFLIKRANQISTLSFTFLQVNNEKEGKLIYKDFYKKNESTVRISLSKTNHDFKKESAKFI